MLSPEGPIRADGQPCLEGHDWQASGKRYCPTGNVQCGQQVYRCSTCGVYDSGYRGGPARAQCIRECGDDMTGWIAGVL
jgi:hypothetical protein